MTGRRARRLAARAGRLNLVTILLLLAVAAVVYFAVLLVPAYVENYKLEEKLRAVANMAHRQKDDEVLAREIQRECKQLELELPYDAIELTRDPAHGQWIRIRTRYIRKVELVPFGASLDLEFSSDILEPLK